MAVPRAGAVARRTGDRVEAGVDGPAEAVPGRPAEFRHRHPAGDVRDPYAEDGTDRGRSRTR
ncbi:hypothetical protein ACIF8T_32000 [Streptomyces sp. NPDC085946]|uniref:hypothetical protein n=1 Tax=Streptomyces sp. NPDC085946 TaxID=3365744 RepID=UPI0037D0F02A